MVLTTRPDIVPGRVALIDGDVMAYACAGNDETPAGVARANMVDRVQRIMWNTGSSKALVLCTVGGSTKGDRYAIATARPYQGHRKSGSKPQNWEMLRAALPSLGDTIPGCRVEMSATQEADDLFAFYAGVHNDVVICTPDKDMRVLPGLHLSWTDCMSTVRVLPGTWETVHDDKVYGRKWFWLQMLHGDSADNIPGCPSVKVKGVLKPCGPVAASRHLVGIEDDRQAMLQVFDAYRDSYVDDAPAQFLEQAMLLWLQTSQQDGFLTVLDSGAPLETFLDDVEGAHEARQTISRRVNEARTLNAQIKTD
jgi:hypothetical protein